MNAIEPTGRRLWYGMYRGQKVNPFHVLQNLPRGLNILNYFCRVSVSVFYKNHFKSCLRHASQVGEQFLFRVTNIMFCMTMLTLILGRASTPV